MARCRKPAHIGSDLGKKDTSRQFANTWHAGQNRDQRAKGCEVGLDLLVDLGDSPVQRIDLLKMQPQEKAVMSRYTPPQGFRKHRGRGFDPDRPSGADRSRPRSTPRSWAAHSHQ